MIEEKIPKYNNQRYVQILRWLNKNSNHEKKCGLKLTKPPITGKLTHVALTHFDAPVSILKLFKSHQMRYLWKELSKTNRMVNFLFLYGFWLRKKYYLSKNTPKVGNYARFRALKWRFWGFGSNLDPILVSNQSLSILLSA